ncbi:vicilin-like antimicrobial peptides 2-2-like [Tripterygium wilfordii]|uniref:Vicilin-like antimicrobial peptides 2-2-like n=1 Tax=Tripterygium wilfordii TaxID=458696 RepID=A0A7J7CVY3_TRIWF|nr:vicilin-like seed storage protein At2g18540 [Tripterygium wilfordii]KAF5738168.1 vicilin-like antimicrobial peptides 2-2-like [Tripterygium wilfordii]
MSNKSTILPLSLLLSLTLFSLLCLHQFPVEALKDDVSGDQPLVTRDQRRTLVVGEDGEISAVDITVENRGPYHLQFITLAPNSLLLPILLHADMVFYVHTGTGRLSWADNNEIKTVHLRRGDVHRLPPGSVFYVESNLETERAKLRIHAIFSNTEEGTYDASIGAFSSISDLVLGFDTKVLQAAFKASEEVLAEITSATRPPAIVHAMPRKKKTKTFWESEARLMLRPFLGGRGGMPYMVNGKKKKSKTFNIFDAEKDVENCNGWSLTVNRKDLHTLEGSNIGIFMVNLTNGSMMGPHWNPMATEVAIVLQGQGMIRVVCSSIAMELGCKNMRFRVKEGDVFAIPRFHPMAQISFNNDSLVFMGFSTSRWTNYPQFLAGKSSVLRTLDEEVLAVSFNVSNTTIHKLLAQQNESIILDCTSCAEEEQRIMEEQEAARKREEEEERKREEEKEREEEEERKREEEQERKREEKEERKREEEERKREEEEEERKREEEEEKRKREEEEARRQEEERERKEREEEEERKREEEEAKKREEEERQREEEKRREEEEEKERREREKQEEEKRRKEEKQKREEAARREQEEARSQAKERQRRQREAEEEAKREREREAKEAAKRRRGCEQRGDCPEKQPEPEPENTKKATSII